jgi:type II secretory pathway component PulF
MPDPVAAADSPLSAAQAEAVLTRAGQIASAGMPLAAGLRAAADEADSSSVARGLRRLAADLDRGQLLDTILARMRLPANLAGLLQAAQRTGHFGAVLAEWMENRRAARQHWRSIQAAIAYPLIVLAMTMTVYVLFLVFLVRPFREIYTEFGLELPTWTQMLFWVADVGVNVVLAAAITLVLVLVVLRLIFGRSGWSWLLTNMPLFGPVWHWTGAAEMLRSLSLLVDHRVPLPEALRLTAGGISDAYIGDQCRALARRVEQGSPLWAALVELRSLPLSIVPLIHWGEKEDALAEALRTASEMLEGRLRVRSGLLVLILPPAVFVLVGTVAASMIGLVIPMIALIQGLS